MADIFDRMLDGINKGVNSIAAGSKTMVEKSRINGIISGLERDKNNIIGQIGYKVYELYKAGELDGYDELAQMCAAIDAKDEEIAARRQEIDRLSASAAHQYGQPYQSGMQQPDAGAASFCPNCGKPNTAGSAFCAHCGTRIG